MATSSNPYQLKKPIVVIGTGRSGSTIISEMLFSHERLAWLTNYNEYLPRWHSVGALRTLFDNKLWRYTGEKDQLNKTRLFNSLLPCPAEAFSFWQHMSRRNLDFARGFLLGETASAIERNQIRSAISDLVERQRRDRFAMKITGPGRIAYLSSIFPNAIFVNVKRNPASTVRSLINTPFWQKQGMNQLWWRGAYSEAELAYFETIKDNPVAATAFQVAKVTKTIDQEAKSCSAPILTIRYEDFVRSPIRQLDKILRFCELDPSTSVYDRLMATPISNQNKRRKPLSDAAQQIVDDTIQFINQPRSV